MGSVDSAAKKLADKSYPMVKATDWATTDVLDKYMASVPTTKEFSKAILELSVALDPKLVKNAVQAHKKAVEAMGPNFITPLKNHEEVTTALAKMFAAAPAFSRQQTKLLRAEATTRVSCVSGRCLSCRV